MNAPPQPQSAQDEPGTRTMRELLDKGTLTRVMVLRSLASGHTGTLRRIAEEIGISVQAVSEHIKRLSENGLIETSDQGPRLTREGHETLAGSLTTIKQYVDQAVRDLARIETTAARADTPIHKGDPVGLFMQHGELIARPGSDSPSSGVALQDAEKGQDVLVGDLKGIVELEPGQVTFVVVPDIQQGGSRDVDLETARRLLEPAGLVVTLGTVAHCIAEAAGADPVRFGGPNVAAEAALVGVDVVVLVEAGRLEETQQRHRRACAEWGLQTESNVRTLGPKE